MGRGYAGETEGVWFCFTIYCSSDGVGAESK